MKRIRTSEPHQSFTHGASGESFTSDENGYCIVPDAVALEMTQTHGSRYATDHEQDSLTVAEPKPGQFVVTTADGVAVHDGFFTSRSFAVQMAQQLKPPSAPIPAPEPKSEPARPLAQPPAPGAQTLHQPSHGTGDAVPIGDKPSEAKPDEVPFPLEEGKTGMNTATENTA